MLIGYGHLLNFLKFTCTLKRSWALIRITRVKNVFMFSLIQKEGLVAVWYFIPSTFHQAIYSAKHVIQCIEETLFYHLNWRDCLSKVKVH